MDVSYQNFSGDRYGCVLYRRAMGIRNNLKNHPLYPVVHAHELQHYLDIRSGALSADFGLFGGLPEGSTLPDELLASEIRAFARMEKTASEIFSITRLLTLRNHEKDSVLKQTYQNLLEFRGRPREYATLLVMVGYQDVVQEARELYGDPRSNAAFLLDFVDRTLGE